MESGITESKSTDTGNTFYDIVIEKNKNRVNVGKLFVTKDGKYTFTPHFYINGCKENFNIPVDSNTHILVDYNGGKDVFGTLQVPYKALIECIEKMLRTV